ncbi:MAG: YicC/YloC family endoribonuclease [Phycisphaeraceae bacterium]
MIRSMTGFGDASEQVDGVHYLVELRSLNNRYFKASIRLPEVLAALEAELEVLLRKRLARGSITLTVSLHDAGARAPQRINDDALLAYLDHLETIHQRFAAQDRAVTIDLTALLELPGVLEPADEQALLRKARPAVAALADRACDKLIAMRDIEGQALARDFALQQEVIARRLDAIRLRAPQVVDEYHQRLRVRIDELLKRAQLDVDQRDLIREVAIFADRADITEEVSRLTGHLAQMKEIIADNDRDPAGRTLEFLAQEMLREANTIASKSNDSPISREIVEVKSAIDRIKEQAANVE